MANFSENIKRYQLRVDQALEKSLPQEQAIPQKLHSAMRYSVFNGGKRIRPVLVYATGSALGAELSYLDAAACAIELIHAYSLVHDDLPAMDDDDLRRGKPTCHIQYDHATAILTGDALQSHAFYVLSQDQNEHISNSTRVEMISILAKASGSMGMAGGQAIDLESVGETLNIAELENMHIHKTGALIRASVLLGALAANINQITLPHDARQRLDHYAKCVGLAFQITDDILDLESDTATLGKTQGSDAAKDKPTYPALIGMSESKKSAQALYQEALDSIQFLGDKGKMLQNIADYIITRQN